MTEQTVGWALHALEPDEEIAVIEHLAGCQQCRWVASDVSEVAAGMATALPQHDPPPGLRDAIVDQAGQTPQLGAAGIGGGERPVPGDRLGSAPSGRHGAPPPAPAGRPGPSSRPAGPAGGSTRPPSGPGRESPSRGRRVRRTGRVLVAAVAVLAVLVGGGVLFGQVQSAQARAQQMEGVLTALAQPGTEHAFLRTDTPAATPVAALILQEGQRALVPMGLEPNQVDDQTYVLWGINGDAAPQAVATFDVRPGAAGPVSIASPVGGTFAQYAVSLERGRTAPAAPSSVIAAGQVET